jgi:hypothetical protein
MIEKYGWKNVTTQTKEQVETAHPDIHVWLD